jgi:dihydrofolate reductase
MIRISMIAAIGKNRELGAKNALLWHIPEDMQYFRDTTRGKPVIMGLNTLRSIGRLLPNRPHIVLTRDISAAEMEFASLQSAGTASNSSSLTFASSLEEAHKIAERKAVELGVDEIFNLGGGTVYTQGLLDADRLYLTLVDAEFPSADVFFPEYERVFVSVVELKESRNKDFRYTFITLEK